VRHQRLQNGPRARLAPRTRRPVVDHARCLVDAVPWTVRAVGAGTGLALAAICPGRDPGAVKRASNMDHVSRGTVQRYSRSSADVTGTLARRLVTLSQRHRGIHCHTPIVIRIYNIGLNTGQGWVENCFEKPRFLGFVKKTNTTFKCVLYYIYRKRCDMA